MLRITQCTNAAGAKSYYSSADYYLDGQELPGVWRGKGAERLGLAGAIANEDWNRLCDLQDPATGQSLYQRRKDYRTCGYDFTFDVPKSVSLLYAQTQDPRLLQAFRDAVAKGRFSRIFLITLQRRFSASQRPSPFLFTARSPCDASRTRAKS